jgi:hypothetical protein
MDLNYFPVEPSSSVYLNSPLSTSFSPSFPSSSSKSASSTSSTTTFQSSSYPSVKKDGFYGSKSNQFSYTQVIVWVVIRVRIRNRGLVLYCSEL